MSEKVKSSRKKSSSSKKSLRRRPASGGEGGGSNGGNVSKRSRRKEDVLANVTVNTYFRDDNFGLLDVLPQKFKIMLFKRLGDVDTLLVKKVYLVSKSFFSNVFLYVEDISMLNFKLPKGDFFKNLCLRAKNLRSLDLGYVNKIDDKLMENISNLSKLRELTLRKTAKVTDKGISCLSEMVQLKSLKMSYCKQLTRIGAVKLAKLRQLETLKLFRYEQLSDWSISTIGTFTMLKGLYLKDCHRIDDNCLSKFKDLVLIENLVITQSSITDIGFQFLTHMNKMEYLSLSKTSNDNFTGAGIEYISHFNKLKKLDLSLCRYVTDVCIEKMVALYNLEYIDLNGLPRLSDNCTVHFNKLKHLMLLDLRSCKKITEKGLDKIDESVYVM
eukprot:TRINITY_DN4793_c0_g1_i1.p1 TRINITY_DN4793_c0_g1~~TRINITY_DN4793_c0_g1_i1.p1  ORF type:complete len:385 (+),score=58.24 TRINITY_DN4793_c0_g1_i1:168-1322(+)